MLRPRPLLGAVETGGTKVVCLVGSGLDDIKADLEIPTTGPEETVDKIVDFFQTAPDSVAAVGLASFGPVDLDVNSPTYGYVTQTTKRGWSNVNILGALQQALAVPIAIDTDVNGAGVGEHEWGAGRGLGNFAYVTVGTGIGGSIILDGRPLRGTSHPELGHIRPPHDLAKDPFAGICSFHGDCLEGLASGAAIVARWGKTLTELGSDHDALELEAQYLAHLCLNLTLIASPQKIILGGGVSKAPGLLQPVRRRTRELLAGYLAAPVFGEDLADYIVRPELGDRAGALGALVLARRLVSST